MTFTIVIPCYNEERNIGRLLTFLQTIPVPEILVYDDGSTDRTPLILKVFESRMKNLRVIRSDKNQGKANALNIMYSEASYDIVVNVDADTLPCKGAIEQVIKPLLNTSHIGAVSGTHKIIANQRHNILTYLNRRIYRAKRNIDEYQSRQGTYYNINGLLYAIRKSALANNIPTTLCDDSYQGYRIYSRGYRILFIPEAESLFSPPQTLKDYIETRRRTIIGRRILQKHFNIKKYMWHQCSFKEYTRFIFTGPLSLPDLASLVFGVFIDLLLRIRYYKLPKNYNLKNWRATPSTKW